MISKVLAILGKGKQKSSDGVIEFLEKQSELYIKAIETKNVEILRDTFTKRTIEYVKEMSYRTDISFGLQRYRRRAWKLVENKEDVCTFEMNLTHENIHVTGKVYVPLGDNITQVWTIKRSDKTNLVIDIFQET